MKFIKNNFWLYFPLKVCIAFFFLDFNSIKKRIKKFNLKYKYNQKL